MYSYNRLHFSFVFAYNLYYIDLDRRCCNKSITLILSQKYNIYRKTPKDLKKTIITAKQKRKNKQKWERRNGKKRDVRVKEITHTSLLLV